jgi:DNA-directed RNA polymerase subunit M/transcription elongation factor TFIIS
MSYKSSYHIFIKMAYEISNPTQFRENIRKKLTEILNSKYPTLLKTVADKHGIKIETVVSNIEKGVFNYAIRECSFRKLVKKWENPAFVQIYVDKLRMLNTNIHSQTVLTGLMDGETLPQGIAFMTHQEIQPDKWNPLIEKKTKRDASKCDKKVGASTAMFTCSRCKSKNCTYYEMQTRSADEPATIFITCLNCDKHWRN